MLIRLLMTTCAFASLALPQKLPTYQWAREVDASGTDTLTGVGTDSQGNIYIVGSTAAPGFPVKGAVQGGIASSGLYRISGSVSTQLGLSSVAALVADPQKPTTLYALSYGALLKSGDGGVTFAATALPSSQVSSFVIQADNDQILFAATTDQGVLKSVDGGATWTPANNGLVQTGGPVTVQNLWIDPTNSAVLLAATTRGLARTVDGATNWQMSTYTDNIETLTFDKNKPGVLYVSGSPNGLAMSTDDGQTFQPFTAKGITELFPDQNRAGRLIGVGPDGLFESTDGGSTWTQKSTTAISLDLVQDTLNNVFYAVAVSQRSVVRISGDLTTVTPVGPQPTAFISALAVANGQLYTGNYGSSDVFVTKLDPLGNIVYSTYFGGTGNDLPTAMTVDAAGNLFVAGTTGSVDFPASKGAYASSGSLFVFHLKPDGSLGYSTYFSGTNPQALATDGSGNVWLTGPAQGGLPVTPGALGTTFCCVGPPGVGPGPQTKEATLTRFDSSGSSLVFSTYIPASGDTSTLGLENPATSLAVASDGTAYVGGAKGIFRIDSTGSSLLSSIAATVNPVSMAFGPDGSLYAAGTPTRQFQVTGGAFQAGLPKLPSVPNFGLPDPQVAVERIDSGLKQVTAATYFSSLYSNLVKAIAVDAAGNVYVGGSTAPLGLPTRTPLAGGFASPTGFLGEISGDLSMLLFSSYFGDSENFTVSGIGIGANGSTVIGGVTGLQGRFANVWLNSLALTPPPALRIDAVENAASLLDGPISAGETIVISGAGFGSDAQVTIGGEAVTPISITANAITVAVPADVPAIAAAVQVQSGGASSNQVLMPVAATAPGIFSADGSGYGQGYILNKDGTLNTPANPAAPGDQITVFATGIGPVAFTQGYAETEFPVNVFVDGIYCGGVAAAMGPMNGFPGAVFRLTVFVPNPAVEFAGSNPPFTFPPLVAMVMKVNGVGSQVGLTISIAQ